jgi:hypothetical protein
MKWIQRNFVALVVAGALSLGLAGPAAAQINVGDGLVSVQIGNVSVLNNLSIGVAADIVAQLCNISVSNVAVLAEQVDRSGRERTVCTDNEQPIIIAQNT